MTTHACPSWCTIHDDPEWIGAHYGDPIDIPVVIERHGASTPVLLIAARSAARSGDWIMLQAEETRLLDLRLDLSSAVRLARAIDRAAGSAVCAP